MRLPLFGVLPIAVIAASLLSCGSEPTSVDFTVTPGNYELEVGGTVQLSPVGAPGNVHWSSSNSAVATVVPETGFVTAVSRGEALVTAVSGRHSASARIVVLEPPAIAFGAPAVDFEATRGDEEPVTASVEVTNGGDGELLNLRVDAVAYGEGQPEGWLDWELEPADEGATLILRADPTGLGRAVHTATVQVAADGAANSPQALSVTLAVLEPALIVLSETAVELAGIPDEVLSTSVQVTNGGDLPLEDLEVEVLAGEAWLSGMLEAAEAPTQLVATASTSGLEEGTYEGTLQVRSGSPGTFPVPLQVTLVVSPGPSIALSPSSVGMEALEGESPDPAFVEVTNSGGGTLSDLSIGAIEYGAGEPAGWLSATLEAGTAATTIRLEAASAALAPGSYTAAVPVTSPVAGNSPRTLAVTLLIGEPPRIAVSPSSLTFAAPEQGDDPDMQLVNVTNAGDGTLDGLSAHVTYTGGGAVGWLSTTWEGGSTTAPTRLEVRPATGSLPLGTYTAEVEVRSAVAGVQPRTVSVTFDVVRSFGVDVWPMFQAECTGCHGSSGTAPRMGTESQAYDNLLAGWVTPGDPDASELTCILDWEPECSNMPQVTQLTSAQRNIVRQWIEQGAFR